MESHPIYKTVPKGHQRELVEKAVALPFVGIYDKPGSGKTKMAFDLIANRAGTTRVIVCLPAGLVPNWKNEAVIHYGGSVELSFVSYGLMSRKKGLPRSLTSTDILVLDESHHLRNPDAERTKYLLRWLNQNSPQIITLTGTPAPNDRRDMYIQAVLCNLPAAEGGFTAFKRRYCELEKDYFGKIVYKGDKNTEELMAQFATCAVFRDKSDFLDLEDKVYSPQYYEYTGKLLVAFKELINEAALLLEDEDSMELAGKSIQNMLRLPSGYVVSEDADEVKHYREIVPFKDSPKVKLLLEILDTLPRSEPVLIYTCFVKEVTMIAELLTALGHTVVTRHGQMSKATKQESIDSFTSGKARFLVATVQSTNEGFTLTHCSKIVYFTNSCSSLQREQSEDRIHRIGQTDICVYYDLIANGMLDEVVMLRLKDKINGQLNWIKVFREFVKTKEN